MRISFSPVKLNNVVNRISPTYFKYQDLKYDTVSFSAQKTEKDMRIAEAVDLGYQIYLNSTKNKNVPIADLIKQKEPDISVLPISELARNMSTAENYGALYSNDFNENMEPIDRKLYVRLHPKNNTKMMQLTHAMETAHEYTHAKQSTSKSHFESMMKLSGGDLQYLRLLNGISGATFSIFDNYIQAEYVMRTLDEKDQAAFLKYGQIVPLSKNMSRYNFLQANGIRNEQEFYSTFNQLFDEFFSLTFEKLQNGSEEVEERIKRYFDTFLANGGTKEQLKKDTRKYCELFAKKEVEAYTTESNLAKKVMKTKGGLNIDAFTIYYELLSEALKSKS